MALDKIIGQDKQRQRLMEALLQNRLAHAYLLYGPDGAGAEALAIELAKAVNCIDGPGEPCQVCQPCRKIQSLQYPDLHVYLPSSTTKSVKEDDNSGEDGGRQDARLDRRLGFMERLAEDPYAPLQYNKNDFHSVDDIRKLRQEAYVKPYEGRRKIVIMFAADRMNTAASNALLKTLEEPPGELMLILTTHNPHAILPTIMSRCQPVHLGRLPETAIAEALISRYQAPPETAAIVARQADGSIEQALISMSDEGAQCREDAFTLLTCIHGDQPIRIFDIVEHISAMHRKKPIVEQLLEMLLSYYRDLFVLAVASDDSMINHVDRLEAMKTVCEKVPAGQIEIGIKDIEEIRQNIIRNAHPQLALTVLALRLRGVRGRTA